MPGGWISANDRLNVRMNLLFKKKMNRSGITPPTFKKRFMECSGYWGKAQSKFTKLSRIVEYGKVTTNIVTQDSDDGNKAHG
jgi:hypothetical protein